MDPSSAAPEKTKPAKPLCRLHGSTTAASPPPSSWFEIRLFYVRIFPCVPNAVPPRLFLSHLRRGLGVTLEINGSRISSSDHSSLTLSRDRVDCSAREVTYVSTNIVRLTGAIDFEVCDEVGNLILCGSLEKLEAPWCNGSIVLEGDHASRDMDRRTGWSMNCYSAASVVSSAFVQPKLGISSPSIEVYVAGYFAGFPSILTQTIQLSPRKKAARPGALDVIPEDEETAGCQERCTEVFPCRKNLLSDTDAEADEYNPEMKAAGFVPEGWYSVEDGQLSWFNAGVGVGMGIGLGMCIGVGIGVGLLMQSYQATTRSFKRRFF